MAKYSFGTYGIPKYGEIDGNRLYYSSGIFGWSYDYQTVSLTWKSILSDPIDIPYVPIAWRLVRSYVGVPDSPYVGDVLDYGDLPSEFRLTYVDTDSNLLENHEVTYTIWVFTASIDGTGAINGYTNSKWINCGSTSVNTVAQTSTADSFKRWLPAAWLNEMSGIGDAVGEAEDTELSRIIDAYSFEYDKINVQASLLQEYADAKNIPSSLLKNKITDLGFLYEPSLGDTYHRSIYKTGNFINSVKGTTAAISVYATALTHWGAPVTIGKNLMLDYNDSSFEESIGRWEQSNIGFAATVTDIGTWTLSQQKYSTSLADLGTTITPPSPGLYDLVFPPRNVGFMRVAATGNAAQRYLSLPNRWQSTATTANKSLYGIPVTPGNKYIFTGWVRTKDARPVGFNSSHTVNAIILFFNASGTFIQSGAYGPSIQYTNTWQEVNTGWVSVDNLTQGTDRSGQIAPPNAAYAAVEFLIGKGTGTVDFLFDMFQFSEITNDYVYEDARLIKVNLETEVKNLTLNPSFSSGTSWWQGYNAEVVQDFNAPSTAQVFGTTVAKVTALSTGNCALLSDWQIVEPGTPHTVGFYVSGPVGRTAKVRMEYSSPQSYEDQIKILSDVDGKYYSPTPYYVDSTSLVLSATAQRKTAYAVSPVLGEDYSKPLVKTSVYFPDAVAGDVFYVSSVMLVASPTIADYFQGNGGVIPANPNTGTFYTLTDCTWDTRSQLNMVTNSAFADTSKWTAAAGTTFTVSTSSPLFGTKRGNVSATGGGEISTVVYYPTGACVGGEDVVISAYIKNVAGTYSISTNGQAIGAFKVSSANASSWTRIHVNRIAEVGETNFTVTISLTDAGSGTKVFHIDGVQAELGRVATPFVDPANGLTTTSANLAQSGETISYRYSSMVNAGYSFYGTRYAEKYQRLESSLGLVTPLGSSYALQTKPSDVGLEEILDTLVTSPSFENNLKGWNGVSANIKRTISRGTLFDEFLTQGAAFCKVASTAATSFGIITDLIDIEPITGYYTSIAVKPENEDAYGTYTLKIQWYAEGGGFLREKTSSMVINRHDRWAYLDIVAPGNKTVGISKVAIASSVVTITTRSIHKFSVGEEVTISINEFPSLAGNATISAVTNNTFSYTFSASNISTTDVVGSARFNNVGVSFAKLEVVCTPTSLGIGRTFHLDKAIFRE